MSKKRGVFDSLSYYKILEVSPTASDNEIKTNYKNLVKHWHPDHNSSPNALDIFQQISQAYDVLKNPQTRLKYDLLSVIYNKNNFPDMNALALLRNLHGQEDLNLRAFRLLEVTGKGFKHNVIDKVYYCSQYEAGGVIAQITKHNWMCGFLGFKAFFINIKALFSNFYNIKNKKNNLVMFLHYALVYDEKGRKEEAFTSLCLARQYAVGNEICYIDRYAKTFTDVKPLVVKSWNFSKLRKIQLFYPFILIAVIGAVLGVTFLRQAEIQKNNRTIIKEEVHFINGSKIFSDISVAKIFDIPIDIYDKERLYHLIKDTNAMHGADESFDVYKRIEKGTTVRITGQTVDNKWLRIMFDNGEMAFVKASELKKGIGNEIPLWSKIYKEK